MQEQRPDQSSRKKFLWWGAAAVTAFSGFRLLKGQKKKQEEKKVETVKMLTQDGRLVEIDKNLVTNKQKASTEEVKQWINKKAQQ